MSRIIQDVVSLLNRLIQLDYDAIEACQAALLRLVDPRDKQPISLALTDHRRHIEELALVVRNLGGEPAAHGDLRQVLTREKVALGALTGDRAILEAVCGNEEEARATYENAGSLPGVPVDVLAVLARHSADETNHIARIVQRLEAMRSPVPGAPVTVPTK